MIPENQRGVVFVAIIAIIVSMWTYTQYLSDKDKVRQSYLSDKDKVRQSYILNRALDKLAEQQNLLQNYYGKLQKAQSKIKREWR